MAVEVVEAAPDSEEAVGLIGELDAYLSGLPYPPQTRHAFSVERLVREGVVFFVVRRGGEPAGCGGVKLFDGYAEVKRMYVRPPHRGRGLGRVVLDRLAEYARGRGVGLLRLETGVYQTEAIGLYERYGFRRRGPFGEYAEDPLTVFFEKPVA